MSHADTEEKIDEVMSVIDEHIDDNDGEGAQSLLEGVIKECRRRLKDLEDGDDGDSDQDGDGG